MNTTKKKKNILSKILKWTGISFLLLIVIIILIPIFFKDKLKDLVLTEIDKMLVAEVKLDDFDLTLFSTFPNLSVKLYGVKVIGTEEFNGVHLADVQTVRADVGLWDVIKGDAISINAIYLKEPKLDVRVLHDGKANYDIMKPDSIKTPEEIEEPSNFQLKLKKYTIEKGNIRYDDKQGGLFAKIINLNHTGKGDLSADVVDFKTKTTTDELSFEMDGISYLSKIKTDIIANLLLEFNENDSKFTLQKNSFQLNELKFAVNGYYQMFENYDDIALEVDADKIAFKELISLIPAFYKTGYESMLASGNMEMHAKVKGKMDDKNMPGWDVGLKVANASIKYPDLPGKIENIAINAGSKFAGGSNLDKMTVDVNKFHADFAGNVIDATLKLRNVMSDPSILSSILAKVDLASISKVIPLSEGEKYEGKLNADIQLDGKMSHIEKEQYDKFKALGLLSLKDFNYVSPELSQNVEIKEVLFRFAPQYLSLEKLEAKTGKSDFAVNGNIDNYMGYLFRDELLKGKFTFNSNFLDLDELMNIVPSAETTTQTENENSPEVSSTDEGIEIPGNIDFELNTKINKAKFNGITIEAINGGVSLRDKKASLNDLNLRAMGGSIGLSGDYDTKNPQKPKANFSYKLNDLDIQQLSKNFITVEKLAPITKHLSGKISSHLNMSTYLTPNLDPILSSINGVGDFSSAMIKVSELKVMDKISEVTKLKNINNQTLNNVKTKFKIENGSVEVHPFDIIMGDMKTNVSGKMNLDQTINYDLKMNVPKEKIPKEMIKVAEQAIANINSLSSKINLTNLIPNEIPINVKVIGTVTDPKVSTNFKEKLLESTGNAKDAIIDGIKDKVNETIDKAKDSVKAVVTDAVDKAKEEVEKQKQQLLSSAQKQADNLKAESKKAADKLRSEADKGYDKAIEAAGSNPLKKKAAEIAAKKIKDEAYKKAKQTEDEANKRADDVMNKARAEANKLK